MLAACVVSRLGQTQLHKSWSDAGERTASRLGLEWVDSSSLGYVLSIGLNMAQVVQRRDFYTYVFGAETRKRKAYYIF
jgi:hypothetical protein